MAKGDMLTAVYDSIGRAMESGQTRAGWKKELGQIFDQKGWDKLEGYALDNIFRTNIQSAYQAGRYRQMMEVADSRPWWQYSAINDGQTRLTHAALHGKIVRNDDPFWDTFYPPNGFRCRCTVKTLSTRQLERKNLKPETIKENDKLEIQKGPYAGQVIELKKDAVFNTNPAKTYWQADTGRFRADVKQLVLKDITKACPEDFCGPCEFAETDCFKRLKKHLTQKDLEDLQTVVWAEGEKVKAGFSEWVDGVLKDMKPKGELYPLGNIPAKVLSKLKKQPRLAIITIDDHQLTHLARTKKSKRNATLNASEIKEIPERIKDADWYFDTSDPALIMTWVRNEDKWIKIVINLDYKVGKKNALYTNHIATGGIVQKENVDGADRYEKI